MLVSDTAHQPTYSMDLIKEILDLVVPDQLTLSPDGKQVVYTGRTKQDNKPRNEEHKRAMWIADTASEKSSRKLTDGTFDDQHPQWSPDGKTIAFLSDRGGRGKSCAIYLLPSSGQSDPKALTPAKSEQKISKYRFSPDGKHIFFIATPERTRERKARDEEGDDVKVWDQDWSFAHFYRVDVESGAVQTLFEENANVADFALNDDGTELIMVTAKTPDIESEYLHGRCISKSRLTPKGLGAAGSVHLPRVIGDVVWNGSMLYFIGYNDPKNSSTGMAVYVIDWESTSSETPKYGRISHGEGEESCARSLRKAGSEVLVFVQQDMEDQIRVLGGPILLRQKTRLVDYDVVQSKGNRKKLILVAASGDVNKPTEVYIADTATSSLHMQLSDHAGKFKHTFARDVHFLSCPTLDGKERIPGIYFAATGAPPNKPLPTYVSIHGGPYYRQNNAFDSMDSFVLFAPLLLAAGIGVLLPDYRGSSGRGERFASYAKYPGWGIYDEPDIVAMTQHAVEKGLADADLLAVGGWSQGGYLSYLSAVRNGGHQFGWKFRCAVMGAGIADWDSMTLTSDLGYVNAEGSGALWALDKSDVSTRSGSALWEFKEAVTLGRIPPVLMVHGEADVRVPVTQALGFRRALEEAGLPFQYVTYPREGHIFGERKHLEDLIARVSGFVKGHLT